MPYFFILPGFVLYVLAMTGLLALTWLHEPFASLRPYVQSVLVWSSAGFITVSVVYGLVSIGLVVAFSRLLDGPLSAIGAFVMVGLLFVGPFVAGGAGLLGGAVVGLWRMRRRTRRSSALS